MHSLCRNLFKMYSGNTIPNTQFPIFVMKHIQVENLQSDFKRHFCSKEYSPEEVLKEVSKGDEEVEHRLKVLMMEMELLREEGALVPPADQMKAKYFVELLKLRHVSGRKRYFEYLFKLCKTKENEMRKKMERTLKYEEYKRTSQPKKDLSFEEFVQSYDLSHNNIFVRIRDATINNFYNRNVINAIQFGQKLIFDCGFHNNMTDRENNYCAKQIMLAFGDNRINDDPYDIHLCNFERTSVLGTRLHSLIPTLYDREFPMNVNEKSYLDLFPKDKLVYLTPHCREEMKEYDPEAFYIIGGIVDKVNQVPLSMARAKELNIKMMKFPLDRYLSWSGGSGKSLTLNQVVLILLDMKKTGDWKYALRHVPRRKIVKDEDLIAEAKEKLLRTKQKWSPKIDLNNLSYGRQNFNSRNPKINLNNSNYGRKNFSFNKNDKPVKRQVSVSSLFRNE